MLCSFFSRIPEASRTLLSKRPRASRKLIFHWSGIVGATQHQTNCCSVNLGHTAPINSKYTPSAFDCLNHILMPNDRGFTHNQAGCRTAWRSRRRFGTLLARRTGSLAALQTTYLLWISGSRSILCQQVSLWPLPEQSLPQLTLLSSKSLVLGCLEVKVHDHVVELPNRG